MSYHFLLDLALILLSTKLLGIATGKFQMPRVVGALLAGLVLGPAVLNILSETAFLSQLSELGVIVILFTAGMGTDLRELRNAGKFADCAGILFGAWTDCPPEDPEKTLEIPEIIREVVLPAGKPTMAGLACGHVLPTMSLPLGATVAMDADNKTLEACV